MIKIFNEDNLITLRRMINENKHVDVVLTSPPYCTPNDDANNYSTQRFDNYQNHYDVFTGFTDEDEYIKYCVELFTNFNIVLSNDGVVLWNVGYTAGNPSLIFRVMCEIEKQTNFRIADCIAWKKDNALPANMNPNRLTRICEFIFVLCKSESMSTFKMNKVKKGSKYAGLFFNFIEAPNNDRLDKSVNRLNNATFSTALVTKLLEMYAQEGAVVYDPFMGIGTTAIACKQLGFDCYGSELSEAQCKLAESRLANEQLKISKSQETLF